MEAISDTALERAEREDELHVGATRSHMVLGIPMELFVLLFVVGYLIQTTIAGWEGLKWAVAFLLPTYGFAFRVAMYDPYGVSVVFAALSTTFKILDRYEWGGASCAPLPARNYSRRAI
jgi:type IV secretory pathway VirB3-like protein